MPTMRVSVAVMMQNASERPTTAHRVGSVARVM
jgi:hypothetical protein